MVPGRKRFPEIWPQASRNLGQGQIVPCTVTTKCVYIVYYVATNTKLQSSNYTATLLRATQLLRWSTAVRSP